MLILQRKSGKSIDPLKYKGEWIDDKWSGHGQLTYQDGAMYDGKWLNGQRDGQGTLSYNDGALYVGHWKSNHWYGEGCYKHKNKSVYEGEWENLGQPRRGTVKRNGQTWTGNSIDVMFGK